MKKWNRVLAMLLATVMLLAVLPMNVFADAWLNAGVQTDKEGTTTATDVTLTLDAAALLTYLKTGDKAGLLSGLNLGELKNAFTKEELNGIFPTEKISEIFSNFVESLDLDLLMQYIDADALLKTADTDALIAQIQNLPNLESYVSDYDALMGYIGEQDLVNALPYVNTSALVEDYADELVPLVLSLDAQTLADLVDLDAVMALDGIDFNDVVKMTYLEETIGLDYLFNHFMDQSGFAAYVQRKVSAEALRPFVDNSALETLVAERNLTYDELKGYLQVSGLYTLIANNYDDLRLNRFVDEVEAETILRDGAWIDATELDAFITGGVLDMSALLQSDLMTDATYDALIAGGAIDVEGMTLGADAPLSVSYLSGHEVVNLQKAVFGDSEVEPLFSVEQLYEGGAIKLRAMMDNSEAENGHPALFTLSEILANDLIDTDALAAQYGYDSLIDMEALKAQINTLSDKTVLIDCVEDAAEAIRTIGISNAVEATCGDYGALIENYVTDVARLMEAVGVRTILDGVISDGKLNAVFDVPAIVRAIGVSELAKLVDLKTVVSQLRENGGWKELLKSIDSDNYVSALTTVLGTLEKNLSEIKINGIAVTEKDGNLLNIKTANLATVLEEILPELEEIAEMGDDGKIFSLSVSVTYCSEETDFVAQTKDLTLNVVLDGGVEQVRTVAATLKSILDRFVTYDFKNGILEAEFTLPTKFATALKVALECLETSGDTELQALKDAVLALYDANATDVTAFVNGLTLQQIVALLNVVDASAFDAAYGKVMTDSYVAVLLNYIKEATGQDFTDLTATDLLIRAGELPTLESLCDKIEAKLGKEISAFDRLPDGDPVEILNRLAAKVGATDSFGYDIDFADLLRDAAAQEVPLEYLYQELVELLEINQDAYELLKNKVVSAMEKLLASQIGDRLNTLHLSDLYRENGVFQYDAKLEYRPIELLNKGVDKLITALESKLSIDGDLLATAKQLLLSYFTDDTLNLGFDISVKVNGLYRIAFYDEELDPIRTVFLPAGTELALIQTYVSATGLAFKGWMDISTHEYYERMPSADVRVVADVDDGMHAVYVVDPDTMAPIGKISIAVGETLAQHRAELEALVLNYLNIPDLLSEDLTWFVVTEIGAQTAFDAWDAVVESDLTLTWALPTNYTVSIYDPNALSGQPVYTLTVREGTALTFEQLQAIREYIRTYANVPDEILNSEILLKDVETGAVYQNAPITQNLKLTWQLPTLYTVKIFDPEQTNGDAIYSLFVREGRTLTEAQVELIRDFIREYANISDETKDKDIILKDLATQRDYDYLSTPINENVRLTWRLAEYYNVTLVNPKNINDIKGSWKICENTKLEDWKQYDTLKELRGNAPEYYQYSWVQVKDGVVTDEYFNEASVVTADLTLTWKQVYADELVTIVIKDFDANKSFEERETIWIFEDIQKGTSLKEFLMSVAYNDEMNCYEWLMARKEASNPALEDYVHEYRFSWNVSLGGTMSSIDSYIIRDHVRLTWDYTIVYESAELGILGGQYNGSEDDHYSIVYANGYWNVVWNGAWGDDQSKELTISKNFLQQVGQNAENTHGLILSASASVHKIQLSNQLLKALWSLIQNTEYETISLRYAPTTASSYHTGSGAIAFTLDFYFGNSTVENAAKVDAGNFDSGEVQVTVPFNAVNQSEDQKTFIIVDQDQEHPLEFISNRVSVTFYAPHFSTFEVVNKYKVYHNNNYDVSALPEDLRADLPDGPIATYPIESDYYEAGHVFEWSSIEPVNGITAIQVDQIRVSDANGEIRLLNASDTYQMPSHAITLQHIAQVAVYRVFYYINGALCSDRTISYTAFTDRDALKLQVATLPEGYDAAAGWAWFELEDLWTTCYAQSDINLFLVNASADDQTVTVNFYNGSTLLKSQSYLIADLADRTQLPTAGSVLGLDASELSKVAYWVDADGKRLTAYTAAEWELALRSGTLNVYVAYSDRNYTIHTDGNVTVSVNGSSVLSAVAGATVKLDIRAVIGMVASVTVKDSTNTIVPFDTANGTFVMPASDVTIVVTYTIAMIDYVDANGQNASDAYGTVRVLPALTVPEGTIWNRDAVSSDLILVSLSFDGKNMIVVYSYELVKTVDERTLIASVQDTFEQAVYRNKYLVNGKVFYDADQALASISDSAEFKEWRTTFSNAVQVALFAPTAADLTPSLLVLCIVLIVVILILLIALFYILYITGKLKPNAFLKVITAIVSAFYAVCMAIAAAGLAIAKFFGYREEDLVEEYPEEALQSDDEPSVTDESVEDDVANATVEEPELATAVSAQVTEEAVEDAASTDESDGEASAAAEDATEDVAETAEESPAVSDETLTEEVAAEEASGESTAESVEVAEPETQTEDVVSDVSVADETVAAEVADLVNEVVTEDVTEDVTAEAEQQTDGTEADEIVAEVSESEPVAEEVIESEVTEDAAEAVIESEVTEDVAEENSETQSTDDEADTTEKED